MSRRFIFRLEAVLQQRVRQEQDVQVALSRTVQARAQAEQVLGQMERQLAADRRAGEQDATLDMEARMRLLFYLDRAEGQIQGQRALLGQWDQEVARVQALLRQASARRRALEKLRERRKDEFMHDLQVKMDRELDERATAHIGNQAG